MIESSVKMASKSTEEVHGHPLSSNALSLGAKGSIVAVPHEHWTEIETATVVKIATVMPREIERVDGTADNPMTAGHNLQGATALGLELWIDMIAVGHASEEREVVREAGEMIGVALDLSMTITKGAGLDAVNEADPVPDWTGEKEAGPGCQRIVEIEAEIGELAHDPAHVLRDGIGLVLVFAGTAAAHEMCAQQETTTILESVTEDGIEIGTVIVIVIVIVNGRIAHHHVDIVKTRPVNLPETARKTERRIENGTEEAALGLGLPLRLQHLHRPKAKTT